MEEIKQDECGNTGDLRGGVWIDILYLVIREDLPHEWQSGRGMKYVKEGTHLWGKSVLGRC